MRCTGCKKDENGQIVEVYAEYDPETRGGNTPDGRKVKGTIHWVDANTALDAEVRLYDNLFSDEDPDAGEMCIRDRLGREGFLFSGPVDLGRYSRLELLDQGIPKRENC